MGSNKFPFLIFTVLLASVFMVSYNINWEKPLEFESKDIKKASVSSKKIVKEAFEPDLSDYGNFYLRLFHTPYVRSWEAANKYTSGSIPEARMPYADNWYPERPKIYENRPRPEGYGTNVHGALATYDRYFYDGREVAVRWENKFHSRSTSWFGHCNGTSVAASRHQEPTNPVEICKDDGNCTTFEPHHIRALLSEIYMSARFHFIAGKRCETDEDDLGPTHLRPEPTLINDCDDIDPGAFHLALVNWIGVQKQPIIFDKSRDLEVWNYPLTSYSYTSKELNEQEAIQATGRPLSSSYIFNPNAVRWMSINLTLTYSNALNFSPLTASNGKNPKNLDYNYLLEIDSKGNIIGGEWLGATQLPEDQRDEKTEYIDGRYKHPDFVWIPFEALQPEPADNDDEDDDNKTANQEVQVEEVIKLWAKSMGFNPDDPFNDPKNPNNILSYPEFQEQWGNVEHYFQLFIDARTSGGVFLGKKTMLEVERKDNLKVPLSVELKLNGKSIETQKVDENQVISFGFDSPSGMNTIELVWTEVPEETGSFLNNKTFRYFAQD